MTATGPYRPSTALSRSVLDASAMITTERADHYITQRDNAGLDEAISDPAAISIRGRAPYLHPVGEDVIPNCSPIRESSPQSPRTAGQPLPRGCLSRLHTFLLGTPGGALRPGNVNPRH